MKFKMNIDTTYFSEILDDVESDVEKLANQIDIIRKRYPFINLDVDINFDMEKFRDGIEIESRKLESDCGTVGYIHCVYWS